MKFITYLKIRHKRSYPRLVDAETVAAALGYDVSAVRRICRDHNDEVRSEKRGRKWFVCLSDLRQFVAAGGHRGPHIDVKQSGDPNLLSIVDAADRLGYSEIGIRRIFKKAAEYNIRTSTIKNKQYISIDDIQRSIDAGILDGPGVK